MKPQSSQGMISDWQWQDRKDFFKRAVWKKQNTKNVFSYIERRNRWQTRKLGEKMAQKTHGEDYLVLMAKFKLRTRK